jgi:hypothetical protein
MFQFVLFAYPRYTRCDQAHLRQHKELFFEAMGDCSFEQQQLRVHRADRAADPVVLAAEETVVFEPLPCVSDAEACAGVNMGEVKVSVTDADPVPVHIQNINLTIIDGVSMSQSLADKFISWANEHSRAIIKSPLPPYRKMLQQSGVSRSSLRFEPTDAEDGEDTHDRDDIRLTHMEMVSPGREDGSAVVHSSLYYRDVSSCLRGILRQPAVVTHGVVCKGEEDEDTNGNRLFFDLDSADSFLHFQRKVELRDEAGAVLYIILYSDETQKRSGGTGGRMFYPLVMSIGNIPLRVRRMRVCKSLVGLIPVDDGSMSKLEYIRLVHRCYSVVVEQVRRLWNTGFVAPVRDCLDRAAGVHDVTFYPVIGLVLGDRKERCRLGGVVDQWNGAMPCPSCTGTGVDQAKVVRADDVEFVERSPDRLPGDAVDVHAGLDGGSSADDDGDNSESAEDGESVGSDGSEDGER